MHVRRRKQYNAKSDLPFTWIASALVSPRGLESEKTTGLQDAFDHVEQ